MKVRGVVRGLGLVGLGLSFGVSAQTYTRTDRVVYHDNLSKWVIGQTESTTNVETGVVAFKTDYDLVTALPIKHYGTGTAAPGPLKQTLTYNADGTVATVKDGNNNVTTLSSWYRGIPRTVQYPATPEAPSGATQTAEVNDKGWITSVTDENGSKSCYAYDPMGRMSEITYTSETTAGVCDASAYNKTTQVFEKVLTAEYGIPAGHWRQTVSTGNARNIVYFDGQWRPVVTREYDTANETATKRFQRFAYDHEGRATFASYPGTSDALTTGTWTGYDALGRVTSASQDTELTPSLQTTLTEYLDGFQTRVTNPRGLQTLTTLYQAYDQPTYEFPRGINHPEGTYTEIYRDVFGKPTALRRRNADASEQAWRHYVYQADQKLCKTIEPETGATIFGYDPADNLIWSAAGHHDLLSTASCNKDEGFAWGRRVDRAYDPRNRLTTLAFPDGRGSQSWSYTRDSLPDSITTYNASGGGEPVVNAYTYNKRRLLTGESSTQPGWYGWGIGYGYDANASLSALTYPTGFVIYQSPNALGQPTQLSDQSSQNYATGISYFPNGALKQFTYGNGIVHTMQQNARQLPARSTDTGVVDYEVSFDNNANPTAILDRVRDHYSRWMAYDGLDRLTDAGSCSFGGDCWHRFTYDALDNLRSWKLPGVKDYAEYVYDTKNQLTSIKNSAGASIVGLAYDVQGNLQNKNGKLYNFDYGNRMREATNAEGMYRYDGHGRRVLSGRADGITVSQYSLSGQLLYYEQTNKGNFEQIYLAGSLLAIRQLGVIKYQHTDALGSPVAVTNTAGAVIERNDYEPYGGMMGNPTYDGMGFTGHKQDAATGLTYMQQRYYDPTIGRFLSVDPVTANSANGGNFNRYWYANNNPYKFTDPDGRIVCNRIRSGMAGCQDDPLGPRDPLKRTACPECQLGEPKTYGGGKYGSKGKAKPKRKSPGPWRGSYEYGNNPPTLAPKAPARTPQSGTIQIGVSTSVAAFGTADAGVGIAMDANGNVALYDTSSYGLGAKADANASVNIIISNANSVRDLSGRGKAISAGGGLLGHFALTGEMSDTQAGQEQVYSGGASLGVGAGGGASGTITNTNVYMLIEHDD